MISRHDILELAALVAVPGPWPGFTGETAAPDYELDIAPVTRELSPRHMIETTAYNGQVPGPLLRSREGQSLAIEVTNHTRRSEVVHWHGLRLPPEIDGAVEEGTAPIEAGETARFDFMPRPAGFRWYHTHTMAMGDLTRAQYPARYEQEFFLALHDWKGQLLSSDDGMLNRRYTVSTMNGKMMGFGEPLRVKEGQRALLHVLNSSATEVHWITLAGHRFRVIGLDGNPVPNPPQTVAMLRLAPADRVCAIVEMNNPGVWLLGEVREHVRAAGMGIAVEYVNRGASLQWQQPTSLVWNYEQFADPAAAAPTEAPIIVPLVFESKFRGHGDMETWTINGNSYPSGLPTALQRGRRYRLQFINRSRDGHPVHLHRHSFELRSIDTPLGRRASVGSKDIRGVVKDVLLVEAQTQAEVELTADNAGNTLFHCHQQNHMDLGFMMLFSYV